MSCLIQINECFSLYKNILDIIGDNISLHILFVRTVAINLWTVSYFVLSNGVMGTRVMKPCLFQCRLAVEDITTVVFCWPNCLSSQPPDRDLPRRRTLLQVKTEPCHFMPCLYYQLPFLKVVMTRRQVSYSL